MVKEPEAQPQNRHCRAPIAPKKELGWGKSLEKERCSRKGGRHPGSDAERKYLVGGRGNSQGTGRELKRLEKWSIGTREIVSKLGVLLLKGIRERGRRGREYTCKKIKPEAWRSPRRGAKHGLRKTH